MHIKYPNRLHLQYFPRSRAIIIDLRLGARVYWFSAGLRWKDYTVGIYNAPITRTGRRWNCDVNELRHLEQQTFSEPAQLFSVVPEQIRDIERRSFQKSEIASPRSVARDS